MDKKFILFDFDGVIADSFRLAFEIKRTICPHITKDVYLKKFEGNINDWEEPINFHTEECLRDTDFFTLYIPRMKREVQIVPEIKGVIIELEKSYTLIVISSTVTNPISVFLKEHGLANCFSQIMGNDVHKSKTEKIKMIFEKYNVEPRNCIFITDTLGDIREAKKVNVESIGITWGFHNPKTLQQGKPFRLIEKPNDLLTAVVDYFKVLE